MQLIFVGRTRPYARKPERGGGMSYGVVLGLPDTQEAGCIQSDTYRGNTTAALDAKFAQIEPGTMLDLEAMPRIFQGKLTGFDISAING